MRRDTALALTFALPLVLVAMGPMLGLPLPEAINGTTHPVANGILQLLPPLLIGFVLGQLFEDNFGRAIRNANGIQFLWERPMTLTLVFATVVFVSMPLIRDWRARKRARMTPK